MLLGILDVAISTSDCAFEKIATINVVDSQTG